jgi:hypothetical protein
MGQFSFVGLTPGTYVVEVLNTAGQIVGTSGSVVVSGGGAMTGVSVTTSAATKAAATPGFFSSHATALILGATAAGVAGGISAATSGTASPSQYRFAFDQGHRRFTPGNVHSREHRGRFRSFPSNRIVQQQLPATFPRLSAPFIRNRLRRRR